MSNWERKFEVKRSSLRPPTVNDYVKSFFCAYLHESGSIHIEPITKWSSAHSIIEHKIPSLEMHHHIYFPIQTQNKNHKNSHTIGGLREKPYSSLTGLPKSQVKKINCLQIMLSYNKGANRKQQHCASAIGHVQYHHFIYNNHDSYNTIARWPI